MNSLSTSTPCSRRMIQISALACALLTLGYGSGWAAKPDTSIPAKPEEHDTQGNPTDYKNPIRDRVVAGVPHYHVTVCEGATLGPWHPWGSGERSSEPSETNNTDKPTPPRKASHGSTGSAGGTDGGVSISGTSAGDSESTVSLTENDGSVSKAIIKIHVIKCDNANKGHRGVTANAATTAWPTGPTLGGLITDGTVQIETFGTGETIGHVADLKIQNLTDQPLSFAVPPMILESGSGKNQHYACPKGKTVALKPHGSATVPMDGVCVDRSKPPVGKGVTGDLVVNEGDPKIPQNPDSHMPPKNANKLLRLCTSKYDAADKLQKDGALKDLPYHDKQKQKDIVVQWSTWTDPRISEITGAPPATKDDLKKVVYKQVEEQGPVTPEKKKKIDQGIDTIFEKVELTTAKAKDLEKPEGSMIAYEQPTSLPRTTVNASDETPSPVVEKEEPKTETVYNPDGSTTTTTTVSAGTGVTTTTETQYPDGTSSSKTDVKYKSGSTFTEVKNRDGTTEQTSTSTGEDGTQRTTVMTEAKDGTSTTTGTEVDKDGNKKVSTTTVDSEGVWNTTSEKTNIDGTKEKRSIPNDGSSTTVFTDKDGNTATTTTDNEGYAKTRTPKGSYSVDPQPDGSLLVHWNILDGTGGSPSYPRGTTITPNMGSNADPNNPHPFIATPPPPLPSSGEGKKP